MCRACCQGRVRAGDRDAMRRPLPSSRTASRHQPPHPAVVLRDRAEVQRRECPAAQHLVEHMRHGQSERPVDPPVPGGAQPDREHEPDEVRQPEQDHAKVSRRVPAGRRDHQTDDQRPGHAREQQHHHGVGGRSHRLLEAQQAPAAAERPATPAPQRQRPRATAGRRPRVGGTSVRKPTSGAGRTGRRGRPMCRPRGRARSLPGPSVRPDRGASPATARRSGPAQPGQFGGAGDGPVPQRTQEARGEHQDPDERHRQRDHRQPRPGVGERPGVSRRVRWCRRPPSRRWPRPRGERRCRGGPRLRPPTARVRRSTPMATTAPTTCRAACDPAVVGRRLPGRTGRMADSRCHARQPRHRPAPAGRAVRVGLRATPDPDARGNARTAGHHRPSRRRTSPPRR